MRRSRRATSCTRRWVTPQPRRTSARRTTSPAVVGPEAPVAALVGAAARSGTGLAGCPAPDERGQARVLRRQLVHADAVHAAPDHGRGALGRETVVAVVQHGRQPRAVLV